MPFRLASILFLFYAMTLLAQNAPDVIWNTRHVINGDDVAYDMVRMQDGGYLLVGNTMAMRTDAAGDSIWTRRFASSGLSELTGITPLPEGDFILTGKRYQAGRYMQGWCLRIHDNGDTIWTRTWGADDYDEFKKSALINGTLFAAGFTTIDSTCKIWLMAYNDSGDSLWSQSWNLEGSEDPYDVIKTPDNGLMICGILNAEDDQNGFALKCSQNGDSLWSRIYGEDSSDAIRDVVIAPDNTYLFCGYSASFSAMDTDAWLFKTDMSGEVIWNRVYGGEEFQYARRILLTSDNGMIVVGSNNAGATESQDFYITKRDADGNSLWARLYGGLDADAAYAICEADSGGFAVAGRSYSSPSEDFDIWMLGFAGVSASFESDIQSGYQPLDVHFFSSSSGNIIQWEWDFDGDGTIDCGDPFPDYTYTEAGIYNVMLRVNDGIYSDTMLREAYIEVEENLPPEIVEFLPADTLLVINSGDEIRFRVTAEDDHNILHLSWWLNGDAVGVTNPMWIHRFDNTGIFTVICRVTDLGYTIDVEWTVEVIVANGEEQLPIPGEVCIIGVFPNPFNPTTTISFSIPKDDKVELKVYNIKGQLVKTLVNDHLEAGMHKAVWNGDNQSGKNVSSGIYLYRLESGGKSKAQKMLLLK